MGNPQRQGYLYGTLVLAAGTVVVKLIGAGFKIPLTNLLGGVGMSCFNVAYDLYYPLYALFVSGVPVAVAKLVSEQVARGQAQQASRLLHRALALFTGLGALGMGLMFLGAEWFSTLVKNPPAALAVRMLAPALFFGCLLAVLRGYWQGMRNMAPTAVSQVVEAAAKLCLGLGLAVAVTRWGLAGYARTGRVFGQLCGSPAEARLALLPYSAAGAILGVTASTCCGALYLAWWHRRHRPRRPAAPSFRGEGRLTRRLLAVAVPVCIASVISNLTSFIDLISVMNRLATAVERAPGLLLAQYRGLIPAGVGLEQLPSYLYGCYSGLTVPLYNLVPALTGTVGVSLLPAVSAAWAVGDREQLERNISSALRISALLAMPAGIGLCLLAEPILGLLYASRPQEAAVILPALRLMGLSSVLLALSLPVNAVLQATGRASAPVKLFCLGGAVKLGCNFVLVADPRLNIQAAPVGTLACCAVVLFGGLWQVLSHTRLQLSIAGVFGKPLLGGLGCGGAAWLAFRLLHQRWTGGWTTLAAIAIGGIFYLFLVVRLKILTKADISMLPGGEKFRKLLEKRLRLG